MGSFAIRASSFDILPSRHKHKLIAVEKQTAGIGQAVPRGVVPEQRHFPCGWLPAQGEAVGRSYLALRWARTRHASGEMLAHPHHEGVVEEGERLQGRHRAGPDIRELRGVRAIEGVQE